ncbi:MAG: hypothetical protein DRI74_07010 [Bacteroidetes bacterium]|nr:MAG: hypothetical protein DRI74_07010 [Bacteroidota bacterium]
MPSIVLKSKIRFGVIFLVVMAIFFNNCPKLFARVGSEGKVVIVKGYGEKNIFVGSTSENLEKITDTIINGDKEGAVAMMLNGVAGVIPVGTEVRIINNDSWQGMVEIRLIGDYSGQTWWAYTKAVTGR